MSVQIQRRLCEAKCSLKLFVLLLSISTAGLAFGQTDNQQISGTVTDATGASVGQADITVTNEATNVSRAVKSNDGGNYVVLNVPVGVYTITTTKAGFKKSVLSGVNVDVGGKPGRAYSDGDWSGYRIRRVKADTGPVQTMMQSLAASSQVLKQPRFS